MIRHLKNKEIDRRKWDRCIDNASNAIVYASSWYLDIVSPGWEALVDDDYASVFPLPQNRKYGFDYLRQPHFTQQLGLFAKGDVSETLLKKYLAVIPPQFKFIEINLNTANHFSSADFKINSGLTHHLDLSSAYDILFNNYSQNLKRNISKALKSEVTLVMDADEKEIVKIFRNNKGKDISALKTKEYGLLLQIVKEARKRNLVHVIGAKTPGNALCAGAIFINYGDKIIFLFSGTSNEAKQVGAMALIIDHMIKSNARRHVILDFEGSMDKNLARFYSSFGSKEAVYLRIRRNNLPKFVRWIKD